MPGQLIPPPELAPSVPDELPPQQRIRMWADLVDACEQFLLAGLRWSVGPDGDVQAAYRQWYMERMEEHDRAICRMCEEFDRRVSTHAR